MKNNIQNKLLEYTMRAFPERKMFCPLPFKHMEIMPNGDTNLCCYIRKSPGIISGNNLFEIYNSDAAQEIRKSILDGTFKYCNLDDCPLFLGGNIPLQKFCNDTIYENIIKQQKTKLDYLNLWLSFDTRCNLKCFSCRNEYHQYSDKQNFEVKRLTKIVETNLANINHLALNGSGEFFMSPHMKDLLYNIDESEYPNLKISLLTNGILLNQKRWEQMHSCQKSIKSIQVSIDAAQKETYEKIRRGGNFDVLTDNLKFISSLRKNNKIQEFIISFVVNAINYKEMKAFIKLGIELNCDQVYFSHIVNWNVMNIENYLDYAVHLPQNNYYMDFLKQFKDPIFNHTIVELGNLKKYKSNSRLRDSMFF